MAITSAAPRVEVCTPRRILSAACELAGVVVSARATRHSNVSRAVFMVGWTLDVGPRVCQDHAADGQNLDEQRRHHEGQEFEGKGREGEDGVGRDDQGYASA